MLIVFAPAPLMTGVAKLANLDAPIGPASQLGNYGPPSRKVAMQCEA